jgi:hypothetical protein
MRGVMRLVPLAQGQLPAAVSRLLGRLDPALGVDAGVVATVVEQGEQLRHQTPR